MNNTDENNYVQILDWSDIDEQKFPQLISEINSHNKITSSSWYKLSDLALAEWTIYCHDREIEGVYERWETDVAAKDDKIEDLEAALRIARERADGNKEDYRNERKRVERLERGWMAAECMALRTMTESDFAKGCKATCPHTRHGVNYCQAVTMDVKGDNND